MKLNEISPGIVLSPSDTLAIILAVHECGTEIVNAKDSLLALLNGGNDPVFEKTFKFKQPPGVNTRFDETLTGFLGGRVVSTGDDRSYTTHEELYRIAKIALTKYNDQPRIIEYLQDIGRQLKTR